MKNLALFLGSFFGLLSIIFGAFGSHLLNEYLISVNRLNPYEVGVKYQFYHSFLLLIVGLISKDIAQKRLKFILIFLVFGIVLFSGSLYILCFTNNPKWGMVTPIGGTLLVISWLILSYNFFNKK